MTENETAILLMQCGCLNDIAEKCTDNRSTPQIRTIQYTLEKLAETWYKIHNVENNTQNEEKNTQKK